MSNKQLTRTEEINYQLSSKMKQLSLLVDDKKKASVYASAIKQIASNKNLKDCNVESIINTAFEVVQAGLNPNPLFGQAYILPFRTKSGYTVAQLQIGYKGWLNLAYRYGWKTRAVAVYKCDIFNIRFGGLSDDITLEPDYEARNEDDGKWVYENLKGVIVYTQDGVGNIFSEFVPFKKLEKIRLKSQNQKAGHLSYIWLEWAEELFKAKAIKYVLTRLPITEQIMDVIVKDDKPIEAEIINEPKQNQNTSSDNLAKELNSMGLSANNNEVVNPQTGEVTQQVSQTEDIPL